jgi:hypothetical protein
MVHYKTNKLLLTILVIFYHLKHLFFDHLNSIWRSFRKQQWQFKQLYQYYIGSYILIWYLFKLYNCIWEGRLNIIRNHIWIELDFNYLQLIEILVYDWFYIYSATWFVFQHFYTNSSYQITQISSNC